MKVSSLFVLVLCSCQLKTAATQVLTSPPVVKTRGVDTILAKTLRKDVEYLASEELNGRETGTGGARKAAHYLAEHFAALGLTPLAGETNYFVPYALSALGVDKTNKSKALKLVGVAAGVREKARKNPKRVIENNVIAVLEGADPARKDEWVVVGAHYDHLGGYIGKGDTIYNGADDNASGTSGMLALARAFATSEKRPARSIVFVGFSGEEKGLLGSKAAVADNKLPPEKIVFMLNLDMIGRADAGKISVIGDGYSTGIKEIVQAANKSVGLLLEMGGQQYSGNSDHHPFYESDVPFLFFFTGLHKDYHQLSDHADKLMYDRMEKIVRVAYGVVNGVASARQPPRFVHHISWLGVRTQVVGEGKRAQITAVVKDSRAARAGIQVGDVVTSFNRQPLERAAAIGKAFRAIRPGAEFELELARAGIAKSVKIIRAKRGYLGVFPGGLSAEQQKVLGLDAREGVFIRGLSDDGPAGSSGIRKDDILIRIAGVPVGMRSLGRHLARIGAGETVDIVVIRNGRRVPLKLTLGERP